MSSYSKNKCLKDYEKKMEDYKNGKDEAGIPVD